MSHEDISGKIFEAQKIAKMNFEIDERIFTVVFFDEANTTDCIGFIKEVMCDDTLDGKAIDTKHGLRLIAACNPYRRYDVCTM